VSDSHGLTFGAAKSTTNFKGTPEDEEILIEVRDRFAYCEDQWQYIRQEAQTDMEYVSGNGWPEKEKKKREDASRPCLSFDELGQYINQLINDVRQNKRAIRVVPRGNGANDKTAELRGNLIREIEYKSNAQTAYATAFESLCQRSYGYWKIVTCYCSEKGFDQEIRIKRIPNPDAVYFDPDCKEIDCSDAKYCYLLDQVPRKEFKKRWPDADTHDFNDEQQSLAPQWIKENSIQVAEYWRVETRKRKLLMVDTSNGPAAMFDDELPDGEHDIQGEREVEERTIMQYITNGVEILERHKWAGKYIPIVPLFGKELYLNESTGPKRMFQSLIRLARDPQQLYNYYRTCEAELIGMTPKAPFVGYTGQFESHKEEWQAVNTTPRAYLQADPVTDATGTNVLPLPTRPQYEPPIQALEIGAEATRQAIRSAMGLSGLPTNVQRLNDKSGVALKEINQSEDKGSFHFIDAYDMGIEYSGRIINDLIPHIYDGAREVGVRKADDTHQTVKINQKFTDESGQEVTFNMDEGEHEVTISTGPSYQSERDQADNFVDLLLPNLAELPIDPGIKQQIFALSIRLKNLGPVGDQIFQILSPPSPGQGQQQVAQMQAQLQQTQQQLQLMTGENQKLYQEKLGKIVDNQFALKKAQMDNEVKILIAEISTKAQVSSERMQMYHEVVTQLFGQAHEAAMSQMEHGQAQQMASQQAANASQSQASDQAHQAQMAQSSASESNEAE
jgi:hypothetical protein